MRANETDRYNAQFFQTVSFINNGNQSIYEVEILFDDGNWTANFTDMNTGRFVSDSMKTSVSSKDVGRTQLLGKNPTTEVQASYRQDYDEEWYVPNAEWKIQIMQPEYGMYLSSYVNLTSQTWTTTFFYEDEELGRGVWSGEGNNQTNGTSDDFDNSTDPFGEFDYDSLPNNLTSSDDEFFHGF